VSLAFTQRCYDAVDAIDANNVNSFSLWRQIRNMSKEKSGKRYRKAETTFVIIADTISTLKFTTNLRIANRVGSPISPGKWIDAATSS
jgi:hypothetical protein